MKRLVTALGICALLFAVQSAEAIDWQGDRADGDWDRGLNWSGDSKPDCDTGGDATIATKDTYWPELTSSDEGVDDLDMNGLAELDTNNNTLFVTGTFTAEDVDEGTMADIAIENVSSSSTGYIKTAQFKIIGGFDGCQVTVTGDTQILTCSSVTCSSATCP